MTSRATLLHLCYITLPHKTAFLKCIFKISTDKNVGSLQAPPIATEPEPQRGKHSRSWVTSWARAVPSHGHTASLPITIHSSAHSFIPKGHVVVPVPQASSLSPQSKRYQKAHAVTEVWGQEPRPPTPSKLPQSLEPGQGRWQRAGRP